ncbi:efflux RND transporter permease subunit [Aestuariibaculum sediminum]|uniref:Efflux RND transporter permease subunit n=1 Tax=Aestuariibaculum sediminum TaxID=2770637 RepID=A0A8J6U9T5_9FLAO|nr:efflux RND transporter permease subunit [Aestuariibaculum sediminum]MBD0833717.1 efflux RND transporter permease subunit [Aestuariibaculum sediminum]
MVKFLIHKPIAVLMTTLGILILGIYALGLIPVSLMPDIDIPEITVQVSVDNMSARQIEDAVVKPLRRNLMQLSHLKDITSESSNGLGVLQLEFNHGTKIDYSFIEVNEKIDRAMAGFPKTMERPKVIKSSATDIPVFYLSMTLKDDGSAKAISSELHPVSQKFVDFNRFANQVIRKRIEQVPEVAMVDISGLVSSEILIIPDQNKLDGLGISLDELEANIKKHDIEIGSLLIKDSQYQYDVRLGNSLKNIQELKDIYIHKNNRLYQLKELAEVLEHPQKRTGLVLSDTKEAIIMAIIKQSDARMGDLKASLNTLMGYLKKDYPNIEFVITRDQTKLLDYAINNLFQSLLWGMLLAFGIMFLFLKNVKSPLLIGIVVPVSLIVCLLCFQWLQISINIISLSGLVLGIGLMIDNSIIVIDNIIQFREQGYKLSKACVKGTNEVIKPLLSSALTTCAVFLPLIFLSGISGALFYDQAMAITIGLFASFVVSITLLPVLYRLFHLKDTNKPGLITKFLTKTNRLDYAAFYERGFKWVMRHQKMAWLVCALLLVLTFGLYNIIPKTQMPNFTTTETLLRIDWNSPIHVEENKSRVLDILGGIQGKLVNQTALVGHQQFLLDKTTQAKTSETTLYLQCHSPEELTETIDIIEKSIQEHYPSTLMEFKDVDNIFNLIFSDNKAKLTARIRPVGDLGDNQNEELKNLWFQLQGQFNELKLKPIVWQDYMTLVANQEKLMTYGVSSNSIFSTLKSAFNEREILTIVDNQSFVSVILGGEKSSVEHILNETTVVSQDSAVFNVKDFVKVVMASDLKTITGGGEGEYYPLSLNLDDKLVNGSMEKIETVVHNNPWYDVNFSGSYFSSQELLGELKIVLLLSLVLLYFILASQFESFTLPLIILLEVPLDLAGAFLFLKLFGMSINLMSMIGIVVMSGIIINDSILKIDTIIQLQKQGYSLMKALLVAGQRRLKPILMTSLTTILALLPLLFSSGLGAELQAPLAVALIGGMLLGTVVSLYFIPLCYYYLSKLQLNVKR